MSVTKVLALDGLNDAKLSEMIERLLMMMPDIDLAEINFLTQKLTLKISGNDVSGTINAAIETLRKADPRISVKMLDRSDRPPENPFDAKSGDLYGIHRSTMDDDSDREASESDESEPEVKRKKAHPTRRRRTLRIKPATIYKAVAIALAAVIFACSPIIPNDTTSMIAAFIALLTVVFMLIAFSSSIQERGYTSCAVLTSITAIAVFFIGSRDAAFFSVLICLGGTAACALALSHFKRGVMSMSELRPSYVTVIYDGEAVAIPIGEIEAGQQIIVNPDTVVPFDGIVSGGDHSFDTYVLTGNPNVETIHSGDKVLCGYLNLSDPVVIEVTQKQYSSESFRMLYSVLQASEKPLAVGALAQRLTLIFSFIMLGAAVVVAFANRSGSPLLASLPLIALTCPCGLTAAVNLVFSASSSCALKQRIMLLNTSIFEAVSAAKTVVTGLAGVLTSGEYYISSVHTATLNENELLEVAAYSESCSEHPIARAIVDDFKETTGLEIEPHRLAMNENIPGAGVRAMLDRQMVLAGSRLLMEEAGVEVPSFDPGNTVVYISVAGEYAGAILLSDDLREGSDLFASHMHSEGVHTVAVVTGRSTESAEALAYSLGVDKVFAECTEKDKLRILKSTREDQEDWKKLIYVGGPLDHKLMLSADAGVVLGSTAPSSASAAIISSELSELPELIHICRRAVNIAWGNVALFAGIRLLLIACGISGLLTLALAATANALLSLLLLLNSMRAGKD